MNKINYTQFPSNRLISLKNLLLTAICYLLLIPANAQNRERRWNLGISGGTTEYAGDLGNGFADFNKTTLSENWQAGASISRYLTRTFDFTLSGNYSKWGYYKERSFNGDFVTGLATIKLKLNNGYLINEDSRIAPYFLVGAGFGRFNQSSNGKSSEGVSYPAVGGAGLNLRITKMLGLNYQILYGYLTQDKFDNAIGGSLNDAFMFHSIGVNFNLGKGDPDSDMDGVSDKKDKCPGTPPGVKTDPKGCPFDSDNDGVMDYEDKCPNIAGVIETKGCPDSDKDGTADIDDQCPNEVGLIALKGCPDTDGDGIIDSKDKCPNAKGELAMSGCPDRDHDGIRDDEDACPDVMGVTAFKGCPDTDNDGVEDSKDRCPDVKGPLSTYGCPDTDNDGIHDGIDKCPEVAGSAQHSGCPDTDRDGTYDDVDRCITIPGSAANEGCPELGTATKRLFQQALQGIQFETGKAVMKPVSFPVLNAIIKVMRDNPSYKLLIGGHTDDVGEDAMNMTLSQDRASAVANYMIAHGVSPLRVTATGYGETEPIDTNSSPKGRTRNRRVEFKVEFLEDVK